jgi:hypothetical protein
VPGIALTLTWLYAVRRGLVKPLTTATQVRAFTTRAFATSAIFLLSVGAAFLGLSVAVLFWLVLLPLARRVLVHVVVRRRARQYST